MTSDKTVARRRYSREFKAQVIGECDVPGASVATFVVPASQSDVTSGKAHATHGDNDLLLGGRLLHAYWDTDAVKAAMRRAKVASPGEYASYLIAKHQPPPMPAGAAVTWPVQWADETLSLSKKAHEGLTLGAKTTVQDRYGGSHDAWPVTAPMSYLRWAPEADEEAIANAGYRLAQLLREIWP
jgi:hypothetical protein